MIAVSLNQLSKKFGRRIGLTGIDLNINEGEIFGLIGPDGAGKSTILRILMNFITPSDGDAEIFDMDVESDSKKIKKETIYVPGEVYFYNKMRAGKYINLVMKAHHHKKDDFFKSVMTAFEVNPKDRFEDMDRSDQKKMALAAAIAAEPRLLLLDEPLRGLDTTLQNRLFEHLKMLQENGCTIVLTGRDAEEIAPICTSIAIIESGEITVTPEEFVAENPAFREREFFMDDNE
ncbi:MAG: ATP-binding cassette domain-containing protein, partial [Firmicutes bacterium]|nr:ATP-binding cassette domain-containing protein [Bacillota bacterium]